MSPPLDTIRFNETPEGVNLGLRVAGPVPRALAFLLDSVVRGALYLALTLLMAFSGVGLGLMLLGFFLLEWFYPVLFEMTKGATPGKSAMGLTVVHDDGTPVGLPASMIRNLLRVLDFLPVLYGVGLVSCLVDRDFRRLGDLAAGTLVVHRERRRPVAAIPQIVSRSPPPGLDVATQQAILSFVERGPRLSTARRVELAEILMADTGPRGPAAVDRVGAWASWLARGQG